MPPPGDWRVWLILAGRGFGKTRAGAEFTIEQVRAGKWRRVALVAETSADARDVMVEGESGIMADSPSDFRPNYEPSKRRLTWPNGAIATTYSGDEPDQLRGPQHDGAWADEPAKWKYPQEAWDNLELGLRLGQNPQAVATTTPRPIKLIRDMLKDSLTVVTRGSTYDNIDNLAPGFKARIIQRYEGTRLGRQELYAEILEDVPGALWTRTDLDKGRVNEPVELTRLIVGVDPEATSEEDSAETGIVVVGLGLDEQAYVLQDASLRDTPDRWGRAAVTAYRTWRANLIVAEDNNGGEMVEFVLHTVDPTAAVERIHASRGKQARAEPVAALYEQGKVHHVGFLPDLEDQLCNWVPGSGPSPDRLDALVWALTVLMLQGGEAYGETSFVTPYQFSPSPY